MNLSLLATALIVVAPAAKDAPKKEPTIVGLWQEEKDQRFGEVGIKSPLNGMRHEFKANGKWTLIYVEGFGQEPMRLEIKLDEKSKPATFDAWSETGGKTSTILGIYKLEGDTLMICFRSSGDRPKVFEKIEGKRGESQMLLIMKRVKKKE